MLLYVVYSIIKLLWTVSRWNKKKQATVNAFSTEDNKAEMQE